MTAKILLVEDDVELGKQIVDTLHRENFELLWLRDGSAALQVDPQVFELIILDLMLPGAYGLDVLKRIRDTSDVPVVILSARNETTDKVRALELGADDFVTKPFWPEELLARLHARLRRPTLQRNGRIEIGGLQIDTSARQVTTDGSRVDLTRVEFDLLVSLSRRSGAAVSRTWLVDHVLDPHREGGVRTLDVHMSRLRKKLGAYGKLVATVWGVGYRLEPPVDPSKTA
ncbi:MAG: response regulator transcription factor [Planctomycetes bacterium]|nr:response regulator transcription factor [Planctomycetota bacterium]MCB9919841.1 response regulator transcription factor [Planctomycetota bacterium]